jgi:hypothetical protein
MVELNHTLIHKARRVITGANIHRVKNLIFRYEQAVILHNTGHKCHKKYQRHYEDLLRQYVSTALAGVPLVERTIELKEEIKRLTDKFNELVRVMRALFRSRR